MGGHRPPAEDEPFAQTARRKTRFDAADILWSARFHDMYGRDTDRVTIDLTRLHEIESVAPPPSL
jgi:hypothetical protein